MSNFVTYKKILRTDVVSSVLIITSSGLFVGGLIGILKRDDGIAEKTPFFIGLLSVYAVFLLFAFLRVLYIKWMLKQPCEVTARLMIGDRRHVISKYVGSICYSFEYNGKGYTHYSSFFLSNNNHEFLSKADSVRISFYPLLRFSLIKDVFEEPMVRTNNI